MTTKQHLHEKLGISFAELGALLGVRNMLAAGLLTTPDYSAEGCHAFNMNHPGRLSECGSIGCIAGSMAMVMNNSYPQSYTIQFSPDGDRGKEKIAALFYPRKSKVDWDLITPTMAVKAIDNFLNYGNPKWETITK